MGYLREEKQKPRLKRSVETEEEELQQLRSWGTGHSHPGLRQGNGIKTEGPKDPQASKVGGGNQGFHHTALSALFEDSHNKLKTFKMF